MSMELQDCRREIDRVDRELLALFARRMALCAEVAAYKRAHDLPVLDRSREAEKLESIRQSCPEDLGDYAVRLFEKLMELSRDYQNHLLDTTQER